MKKQNVAHKNPAVEFDKLALVRINKVLDQHNITASKLSKLTGIHRTSCHRYRTGKSIPTAANILKIIFTLEHLNLFAIYKELIVMCLNNKPD